ncbi:hypothetical protein [Isoptericola sp. NPDC055881]
MTTITAALLTSADPRPVQILVSDLEAGIEYEVHRVGAGEEVLVQGGAAISDGAQIRLIDTRTPVNVGVQYRITLSTGEDFTSSLVTVPWAPAGAEDRYLLQSMDSSIVVPIEAWVDNGLPSSPSLHSSTFEIHGRSRPVMVLAAGGVGTMQASLRLSREASAALREVLALGGAVVLRTNGDARDLPASDLAVITAASSVLWGGDSGVSTSRVWDLTLTWVDDPEPSVVPTIYSWDDLDALMTTLGYTFDDFDAQIDGLTWDGVDAFDWGGLAP